MDVAGLIEQRFARWLANRLPAARQQTLNQRRIFVFPSRQGVLYLALLLALLLAAINYKNNLAYALTFFLASLFNTAILFTYLNISGLQLKAGKATPVFAGEHAEFAIQLGRQGSRAHHHLLLYWPFQPAQRHDLVNVDQLLIRLHCLAPQRGRFRPGRLRVESFYPLGFIRCWSWVDLDFEVVVYPAPLLPTPLPTAPASGQSGRERPLAGNEDFWGFRDYVPGEPLRHVDWRSLARGQRLQSKIFAGKEDEQTWVDWQAMAGHGVEQRLSLLCGWVLALDTAGKPYGLRLPGREIAPASGERHRHEVLTALALYGEVD